jgi:hypothetical protein
MKNIYIKETAQNSLSIYKDFSKKSAVFLANFKKK